MKRVTITLIFFCIIIIHAFSTAFASSLYEGTWSSANILGGPFYVPAGTWTEHVVSSGPTDVQFIGSTGSMIANDFSSPPYPSPFAANPEWQFTSFTRTGCVGSLVPQGGGIYSGNFAATYIGDWQFKFRNGSNPSIYDTYSVSNMDVVVNYTMTYNAITKLYGLSGITWNGEGLIDQDHNFRFIMYAEGTETNTVNPQTGIHSGDITLAQGTIAAVPIPAGVWLLGSALFGMIGMRRKFDN
jgi:hypothetical protein